LAEALLWGLVAGSSLAVGGALALSLPISRLVLGLVMAFGAGVLISAVAYELVDEAVTTSAGSGGVALGLFAGALTFFVATRSSTGWAEPSARTPAADRRRARRPRSSWASCSTASRRRP
jgi:zinc transporter ZupT